MSMNQEDIEALMENLDFKESGSNNSKDTAQNKTVNTKELEKLLAQNQESKELDEVLIKKSTIDKAHNSDKNQSKDNKINEIEGLLTDIDEKSNKHDELSKQLSDSSNSLQSTSFSTKNNTNVVEQLDEVAHDSEEKVSQLFDVLSLNLENNTSIKKTFQEYNVVIEEEIRMLNALSTKFPNIKLFQEHLNNIKKIKDSIKIQQNLLQKEDKLILQGIELMQFDDINRQKIQKVMLIIKKLSIFLNNLFEDNDFALNLPDIKDLKIDGENEFVGNELDNLIKNFKTNLTKDKL